MTESLLIGLALMLVFEGVLPFISPRTWKDAFQRILEMPDRQLRWAGLGSMLLGLGLLYWIK